MMVQTFFGLLRSFELVFSDHPYRKDTTGDMSVSDFYLISVGTFSSSNLTPSLLGTSLNYLQSQALELDPIRKQKL